MTRRMLSIALFCLSIAAFQLEIVHSLHSIGVHLPGFILPAYDIVAWLENRNSFLRQMFDLTPWLTLLILALISGFAWEQMDVDYLLQERKLERDALKLLLAKADGADRLMQLQTIDGLRVNVVPPRVVPESLLNLLLPDICREVVLGDLCERYRTKMIPLYIDRFGRTAGFFAARRWYQAQILSSVGRLLWYQLTGR